MTNQPEATLPPVRIRATNADRERVLTLIATSVTDGALTSEEGDTRSASAQAAVYRDDLDPLVIDLPVAAVPRDTGLPRTTGGVRAVMARHRALSWVVAVVVALVVLTGVVAAGFAAFDGGHGGDRGPGSTRMHDQRGR